MLSPFCVESNCSNIITGSFGDVNFIDAVLDRVYIYLSHILSTNNLSVSLAVVLFIGDHVLLVDLNGVKIWSMIKLNEASKPIRRWWPIIKMFASLFPD